jgi:hypothetical protein
MSNDDEVARAERATMRLTAHQRQLVTSCLDAVARGPYIPDWEFQTLIGLSRAGVSEVAATWPHVVGADTFLVVNNALNNLLGYPHGQWSDLALVLGADERAVADALETWHAEDGPTGSGGDYVDLLM